LKTSSLTFIVPAGKEKFFFKLGAAFQRIFPKRVTFIVSLLFVVCCCVLFIDSSEYYYESILRKMKAGLMEIAKDACRYLQDERCVRARVCERSGCKDLQIDCRI